jgi:hypothetical protein
MTTFQEAMEMMIFMEVLAQIPWTAARELIILIVVVVPTLYLI